jgi:hypothetical protein
MKPTVQPRGHGAVSSAFGSRHGGSPGGKPEGTRPGKAPLPGGRTLLFPEGLLSGGHGRGPVHPFAVQAARRGGVEEFGDGPPGAGGPLIIWVPAKAPQQFHPGPGRLVLGDQREKPVLVTDGELGDVRGQRACIAGCLGQPWTGLGGDPQKPGVKAKEAGQGALRGGK